MMASDSLVSEPLRGDSIPESVPLGASDAVPTPEHARHARDPFPSPGPDALPSPARDAAPPPGPEVDRQAALRALRNLEATEARLERNARREADDARGKLVQELLPVLDNLDRTIRAAQSGRDPAILEGVRLVRHQLEGVLRGYGVERVDAIGKRFDPGLHEAIGVTAVGDPARHGLVVQQAEPGYRFAGKLLRPAKVSVGKLAAPAEAAPRPFWR
jgi:molecular chaperone GrpE (heat shock protein)